MRFQNKKQMARDKREKLHSAIVRGVDKCIIGLGKLTIEELTPAAQSRFSEIWANTLCMECPECFAIPAKSRSTLPVTSRDDPWKSVKEIIAKWKDKTKDAITEKDKTQFLSKLDTLKKLFPTNDNSQPRITNLEKVLTKEQVVNVHKVESKISKEKDKEHSTFKSIKESVDYIIKQWGNKKETQITEKDYNEYIKVRNKFFKDFEKVFGIVANDRNILRILGENINKSLFLISFVFSRYEAIRKTKDTIFDFPLGKKIYRAFYDDRKEINLSKEDVDIIINNKIIKEQLKNQILYKFGFDVKAEVEFNLKNINTNLYKLLDLIYCQANFQNIKTAGISDNEVYLTGKLLVRLDRHLVWNDYKGKIPDDLFKQIPEKRELFLKFIYDNQETVPVKLDRISSLKRRTINVKEIPSKQRSLFGTVIYRDELGREHMECETGLGFVSLSPGMQKLAGAVVFYTSSTIRVAGGSVEIVCGIVMIAGTKGLATVGGVILIANGTDNVVAGVRSIWSGQYKEAFLEQGVKYGVKQMGGSELAGDIAYMGTQIIIPVSATALAKLDKAGKLMRFFNKTQNKYIQKLSSQTDDILENTLKSSNKAIKGQDAEGLIHLTDSKSFEKIMSMDNIKIGGKWGVFALDKNKVPKSLWGRFFKTLVPKKLKGEIEIPKEMIKYFKKPPPFGFFSGIRRKMGVQSTKCLGSLEFKSGMFIKNEIFKNGIFRQATKLEIIEYVAHQFMLDYGYDIIIYSGLGSKIILEGYNVTNNEIYIEGNIKGKNDEEKR